jgi:hypothetical protein
VTAADAVCQVNLPACHFRHAYHRFVSHDITPERVVVVRTVALLLGRVCNYTAETMRGVTARSLTESAKVGRQASADDGVLTTNT